MLESRIEKADRRAHTQDNYSNPPACVPRVNNSEATFHFKGASYRDYRDILVKHPITVVLYSLHSLRYSLQLTIMSLRVKLLEDLGYSGFALGFFEEDIHPNLIQYLASLIMARK